MDDGELVARQLALQAEASEVLTYLNLGDRFGDVGPVLVMGSYVSGLMCWRDLDVGLLAWPAFSPEDTLDLLRRIVELPGVTAFQYRDERGDRCPTREVRDERYHLPFDLDWADARWRIDLSVWLHDIHSNITAWHEQLRARLTAEQRRAVLRIKDVWHRLPDYPDEIGGHDIYEAVLDAGVRTPKQFAAWLARHRD